MTFSTPRQYLIAVALLISILGQAATAQESEVTRYSQFDSSSCALFTDRRVACLPGSSLLQYQVAALPPADAISTSSTVRAVLRDGDLQCAGLGAFGELRVPVDDAPYQTISPGRVHTCAIGASGQPACRGNDE